jgi:hypothetical protein
MEEETKNRREEEKIIGRKSRGKKDPFPKRCVF